MSLSLSESDDEELQQRSLTRDYCDILNIKEYILQQIQTKSLCVLQTRSRTIVYLHYKIWLITCMTYMCLYYIPSKIKLSTMMTGIIYLHPSILAKIGATLDVLSNRATQ